MADTLLDVRDLTISFADSSPVRSLDFAVRQRETVAIVGESGSGKSLTALALMRLLPKTARVTSGSINFAGQDLTGRSDRAMRERRGRDIAMIFQEPMTSLNPVITIGKQIGEAGGNLLDVLGLGAGFQFEQMEQPSFGFEEAAIGGV